jgi:hypothetical protein
VSTSISSLLCKERVKFPHLYKLNILCFTGCGYLFQISFFNVFRVATHRSSSFLSCKCRLSFWFLRSFLGLRSAFECPLIANTVTENFTRFWLILLFTWRWKYRELAVKRLFLCIYNFRFFSKQIIGFAIIDNWCLSFLFFHFSFKSGA